MKVFPTTYALEVYASESRTVTLSQESSYGPGEPDTISVHVDHISALIYALQAARAEVEELQ